MHYHPLFAWILITAFTQSPIAFAASSGGQGDAEVISEATAGKMKATKGEYFEKDCNESVDYDAEVVDLNGDGQPEVFTQVHGTCVGGMAGVNMNLYIKNKNGQWTPQFDFPGIYEVLKTKNKV